MRIFGRLAEPLGVRHLLAERNARRFGQAHQQRRFENANTLVSNQQRGIFSEVSSLTSATQFLSQMSLVLLFAYGGWLYVHDRIALGSGLVVFAGLLHGGGYVRLSRPQMHRMPPRQLQGHASTPSASAQNSNLHGGIR